MNVQSLSVVVPNRVCVNDCKFCVSKMHCEQYENKMDDGQPLYDLALKDCLKRLEFARNNGCNTLMLTGCTEPQQNRRFLTTFGLLMQLMRNPFEWVEMQTTGVLLDANYLRFLRNHVGVNLISLSVSALDDKRNREIIGAKSGLNLAELSHNIKQYDFSLRLSLNLTQCFDLYADCPDYLFRVCKEDYGADQITMRILYSDGGSTPQSRWIAENAAKPETARAIWNYIRNNGKPLGTLPYGAEKFSLHGMCVVLDDDCMAKRRDSTAENYKYLILQPDCKLYSQWDDPASRIF